nr:hypothetical protein [Lentzea atacamensis]
MNRRANAVFDRPAFPASSVTVHRGAGFWCTLLSAVATTGSVNAAHQPAPGLRADSSSSQARSR